MSGEPEVLAAAYHRNGVGGVGFYVGLIGDTDETEKLVIIFDDDRACYTAVLDVDKVAERNIYMHPQPGKPGTGGNAWRGDHYAHLKPRFEAIVDQQHEALMADLARPKEAKE